MSVPIADVVIAFPQIIEVFNVQVVYIGMAFVQTHVGGQHGILILDGFASDPGGMMDKHHFGHLFFDGACYQGTHRRGVVALGAPENEESVPEFRLALFLLN